NHGHRNRDARAAAWAARRAGHVEILPDDEARHASARAAEMRHSALLAAETGAAALPHARAAGPASHTSAGASLGGPGNAPGATAERASGMCRKGIFVHADDGTNPARRCKRARRDSGRLGENLSDEGC